LPWAKEYFTQKLINLKHSDNEIEIEVTNLKSVDGDCDLNQRKGQIIHIFDLKLILEWVGRKGNLEATGKIEIPEFMHDTKFNEIVLDITMDSPTREKYDIKEFARVGFGPFLRKQFENFHADLMDGN
jgi:activator of HSP90 ATPase